MLDLFHLLLPSVGAGEVTYPACALVSSSGKWGSECHEPQEVTKMELITMN